MTDIVLSRETPRISAEKFLAEKRPNLINQQAEWLDWNGGAYIAVEEATIVAEIAAFASGAKMIAVNRQTMKKKHVPFNPKPADVTSITESLRSLVHKPADTMSPPCWLDGHEGSDPKNIISCENGLLDITTRELHEQTPAFFTRTLIPVQYDPDAPVPEKWLAFLDEVTMHRQSLIDLLQEITGYLLSSDTSMQRVFHLWGKPRSGKGTIMRVWDQLMGPRNVTHPAIETLAGRFGCEGVIGKSGLFVTDMDCDNKQALGTAATRINAISGEDGITAERKGRIDWHGTLSARIVLAGNSLPSFGTHTAAMLTRLLVIAFELSFVGREDRDLTKKLLAEISGILNWGLVGLDRLKARGDFLEPQESKAAKIRMTHVSDPLSGMIEEWCKLKSRAAVSKDVLYQVYVAYCEDNGSAPMAKNTFSEKLQELFPVRAYRRGRKGTQGHAFCGIRLADHVMPKWFEVDHELTALGFEGIEALKRDAQNWPIPRTAPDFD